MNARACVICNGSLEGRRPEAITCSDRCRMRAYRERKAEPQASVTAAVTGGGVTPAVLPAPAVVPEPIVVAPAPSDFIGGPCSDPLRCAHFMRRPTGPWTCAWNHPRIGERA